MEGTLRARLDQRLPVLWRNVFGLGDKLGNVLSAMFELNRSCRGGLMLQAYPGSPSGRRPNGAWHKAATTIWADIE